MSEDITLDLHLHPAQMQVFTSPARFTSVAAGRRFGKSDLAMKRTTTKAMSPLNVKRKPCWIIAPNHPQAKQIYWSGMMDMLHPLIENSNSNEGLIYLKNKVQVGIKGADRPDSLRGVGLFHAELDEFADMKAETWEAIIRPALADVRGTAGFIGCVTADTIILGERGLEEIGRSPLGYAPEHKRVYGLGGFHVADRRYGNPKLPTKRLCTRAGLMLEATPNHQVWTPDGWRRMDELEPGDPVYMQVGQEVYGTEDCDLDWAYFLGLYVAEGNAELRVYRTTITSGDDEIHEWLAATFGFRRHDKFHSRLNSKEFMERLLAWLPDAGSVRAPRKRLSERVLKLRRQAMMRVLSGYFDGDGTVGRRRRVSSTSSSKVLSRQVQMLLINAGMRASLSEWLTPPTKRVRVSSMGYRVDVAGMSAIRFAKEIGFGLARKQEHTAHWRDSCGHLYWFARDDFGRLTGQDGYLGRVRKITRRVLDRIDPTRVHDRQLLADEVEEVQDGEAETFDFCIPDTHSYFSNGLVSHNTPRGRNHFFRLHTDAESDKTGEWQAFHFTTYDNPYIDTKEIEAAQRSMSSAMFRQEFLASFETGGSDMMNREWLTYGDEPQRIVNMAGTSVVETIPGDWFVAVDLAGFADVAKSSMLKMKHLDETAIAVVKILEDGMWWVRDVYRGRWGVKETARRIVDAVQSCETLNLGIEKGALYNAVAPDLMAEAARRGMPLTPQPLTHGNRDKVDRVTWALQGRFENRRILLRKAEWNRDFEDQFAHFPSVIVHDDMMDALAYIAQLAKDKVFENFGHVEQESYWEPIDRSIGF